MIEPDDAEAVRRLQRAAYLIALWATILARETEIKVAVLNSYYYWFCSQSANAATLAALVEPQIELGKREGHALLASLQQEIGRAEQLRAEAVAEHDRAEAFRSHLDLREMEIAEREERVNRVEDLDQERGRFERERAEFVAWQAEQQLALEDADVALGTRAAQLDTREARLRGRWLVLFCVKAAITAVCILLVAHWTTNRMMSKHYNTLAMIEQREADLARRASAVMASESGLNDERREIENHVATINRDLTDQQLALDAQRQQLDERDAAMREIGAQLDMRSGALDMKETEIIRRERAISAAEQRIGARSEPRRAVTIVNTLQLPMDLTVGATRARLIGSGTERVIIEPGTHFYRIVAAGGWTSSGKISIDAAHQILSIAGSYEALALIAR